MKISTMENYLDKVSEGTDFSFKIDVERNGEITLYMQGDNPCGEDWCETLDVGNACLVNGIQLEGTSWGGHEGYDTHQFVTNYWSHLVGFVQNGKSAIFELGIDAGGACGEYDFRTNGIEIYDIHEKTREKISPSLYHMKKFLENFDTFESEFYKYVDNLTK